MNQAAPDHTIYSAKVLADSVADRTRLTTIEATFPRFILAEANTHRALARNSASSRAIPVEKRIQQVRENPFMPSAFAKNKAGMQATEEIAEQLRARTYWLEAAVDACTQAEKLVALGVHKQHANRLLEPFAKHTAIFTATEWENFFNLRTDPGAQPEMQIIARLMQDAYQESRPEFLKPGEWHLPHTTGIERAQDLIAAVKMSVVRCAAISFERQTAERTFEQIEARHGDMVRQGHWSPFEHQAQVMATGSQPPFGPRYRFEEQEEGSVWLLGRRGRWREDGWFCGNLRAPFLQYRKMFSGEAVFQGQTT